MHFLAPQLVMSYDEDALEGFRQVQSPVTRFPDEFIDNE
jgi:hypothetical protein